MIHHVASRLFRAPSGHESSAAHRQSRCLGFKPLPKPSFCLHLVGMLLAAAGFTMAAGGHSWAAPAPTDPPAAVASVETDHFWLEARSQVDHGVMQRITDDHLQLAGDLDNYKIRHGSLEKKQVAITFDDGPHPAYTPKILEILKRYHARATFFLVGKMAEKYPNLVKAELADGHNVGNHTYHHINLVKASNEDVATEIAGCGEVLKNITGRTPHLFRPPGGDYNNRVAEDAEALGYTVVLWNDNPGDYSHPKEDLLESRLLKHLHNGSIILIHDGIKETIDILPKLLSILHARGYETVTIDQMMHSDSTSSLLARVPLHVRSQRLRMNADSKRRRTA